MGLPHIKKRINTAPSTGHRTWVYPMFDSVDAVAPEKLVKTCFPKPKIYYVVRNSENGARAAIGLVAANFCDGLSSRKFVPHYFFEIIRFSEKLRKIQNIKEKLKIFFFYKYINGRLQKCSLDLDR